MRLAAPRSAVNSASVVMKVGTLNQRRMLPVNTPVRKPSVMATSTPTVTAATEPIRADKAPENQATTHPARATAAPTDRSISPAMITAVMPNAMMPSIDTVRSTLKKLPSVAKPGATTMRTTTMTSRIASIV